LERRTSTPNRHARIVVSAATITIVTIACCFWNDDAAIDDDDTTSYLANGVTVPRVDIARVRVFGVLELRRVISGPPILFWGFPLALTGLQRPSITVVFLMG
jgi:hypothetical protein